MPIDEDKLRDLAATLSEDQRQLLREALTDGRDPDPETLTASLRDFDAHSMFSSLGYDVRTAGFVASEAADAGARDAGAPDGGAPDGGTHPPHTVAPEPPLTRW
jgi:hypothetical protein